MTEMDFEIPKRDETLFITFTERGVDFEVFDGLRPGPACAGQDPCTEDGAMDMALYHVKRFIGAGVGHIEFRFENAYFCADSLVVRKVEDDFDELMFEISHDLEKFKQFVLREMRAVGILLSGVGISVRR